MIPMMAAAPPTAPSSSRDHLTQRAAPSSGGDPQHEVVLHTSGEHRADDDPDGAGQITHLHRQHRADERTRARDRGEVMAEQHAPVGRHVVGVVLEHLGRRCVVVARTDDLHLDQPRVEPEADHVGADRRDDEPHRVDRLPAEERDDRPGDRTEQRDDPEDDLVSGGDRRSVDDRYRRQVLLGADVGDVAVVFLDALRRCGGGCSHGLSLDIAVLPVSGDPFTARNGVGAIAEVSIRL